MFNCAALQLAVQLTSPGPATPALEKQGGEIDLQITAKKGAATVWNLLLQTAAFRTFWADVPIQGRRQEKLRGGAYGGLGYQTPLKNENSSDLGLFKLKMSKIRRKK